MKKRIIIVLLVTVIIICVISFFFIKKDYKKISSGNNISSKNIEQKIEYILNISSYEAEVTINIESNKNSNKYIAEQMYSNNIYKQKVKEPKNIEGLTMVYDGLNLKIENTKLNLSKIYTNYNYINENHLFLNTFVNNYNKDNESSYKETEAEIIMQTKLKDGANKYNVYKKLYINKNTGKPTKLEVQDINKNVLVYILYNDIEINDINSKTILS